MSERAKSPHCRLDKPGDEQYVLTVDVAAAALDREIAPLDVVCPEVAEDSLGAVQAGLVCRAFECEVPPGLVFYFVAHRNLSMSHRVRAG